MDGNSVYSSSFGCINGGCLNDTARSAIRESTRQRMLDIANCAAGSIDGDVLKVIQKEDEGDGRYTFTVDPALEDPAEFGSDVVLTKALYNASKGKADVDKEPYTDAWGSFYSAYSPVFDSERNVAGIVAVDFSLEWYEGQQVEKMKSTLVSYLVILIILLSVIGIICYLQVRSITTPIERIASVAACYEKGDFSEALEIKRNDEIGVLSRALQSMATSLTEQIRRTEEANRAKSNFLANISHEIRTPMNVVLGMDEMILREAKDSDILSYAEAIQHSGTTLLEIINDILDFSKIESGKLEIHPAAYDLRKKRR